MAWIVEAEEALELILTNIADDGEIINIPEGGSSGSFWAGAGASSLPMIGVESIRKIRKDKGIARGPQKRTIEKNAMGKEDSDAPILHNSSNPGVGRGVPLPSEENMPKNEGTGDHEVDVVPPPKRIALCCPDYFTIDMVLCETATWSIIRTNSAPTFYLPEKLFSIRLNSIFDPILADNRSVIGIPVPSTHQPMGRDTWASIYQYYRVLSADVDISVVNKSSFNSSLGESESIVAGIEWTDTDSAGGLAQTLTAFMEEKNCMWKVIQPTPRNVSGGGGAGGVAHFNYHYTPESWDYHVQNSSSDTRWTAINSSPSQAHYLALSYFPFIPGVVATSTYSGEVTFKIKYTVQFRETPYSITQTSV